MSDRMVRVRIAPSPTGDPHVGTGYIGLFNLVWARKNGGKFVLRIEDTDQARSTAESEDAILRSLKWLGLEWDEGPDIGGPYGPYRQSERTEIYREHMAQLIASGHAYRCFCTSERISELRREQVEAKAAFLGYDGRCRCLSPEQAQAKLEAGEPHVVRMAFPKEGATLVVDSLRGAIEFENTQIDDQILMKSDGFPTYHLANVVDDHLMGITDVIRAEEWISSTPKHARLYEAFGWEVPRFWHMPLLRNPDKSKISKRKNPVSIDYYERAGFLPEALRNYLGRMGWSMPDDQEKFTLDEMIEAFSFDRIALGGPVFDVQKLRWLNGLYIRELAPEVLADRVAQAYLSRERLLEVVPLVHERIEQLDELIPMTSYMFGGGLSYPWEDLVPTKKFKGTAADVREALLAAADVLDNVSPFTAENLEQPLRDLAKEIGFKAGHLFVPLRVAITGRMAAPPLFETMEVVGGALCRARVRAAAALLNGKELPQS